MKNKIAFTVLLGTSVFAFLVCGCSDDNSTHTMIQLTFDDEMTAGSPVWSPSGNNIVFMGIGDEGRGIWTMDTEGGNLSLLLRCDEVGLGVNGLNPSDYSDDEYLLFTDDSDNIYYLPPVKGEFVYICQGERPTVKGNLDGYYNIAYIVLGNGVENGIYLTDIHGSQPQLVVQGHLFSTHWSPDGDKLVYLRSEYLGGYEMDYKLCIYDLPSQKEEVIYETNLDLCFPRWSYDGEWIAFGGYYVPPGYEYGHKEVWVISAEGGEPERLTEFPYGPGLEMPGVSSLSWSPDGKWIVYDIMWRELWKVSME